MIEEATGFPVNKVSKKQKVKRKVSVINGCKGGFGGFSSPAISSLTKFNYLNFFQNVFCANFIWENGENIKFTRDALNIIEKTIFYKGRIALVRVLDQYYFTDFSTQSTLTHYGTPKTIRTISRNPYFNSIEVDEDNFIILFHSLGVSFGGFNSNSMSVTPIINFVTEYSNFLKEIDLALNVNLINSNSSLLFNVKNVAQKNNIITAYNEMREGKPLIVSNVNLGINNPPPAMSQNVDFIAVELNRLREFYINEILNNLGVQTSTNSNGRQYVNEQEINNDTYLNGLIRNSCYQNRLNFCKEVYDKFGVDIRVRKNEVNNGQLISNN